MTPVQFITELFGDGWTHSQLPVFLVMLQQAQEDARRYHLVRDKIAEDNEILIACMNLLLQFHHLTISIYNSLYNSLFTLNQRGLGGY